MIIFSQVLIKRVLITITSVFELYKSFKKDHQNGKEKEKLIKKNQSERNTCLYLCPQVWEVLSAGQSCENDAEDFEEGHFPSFLSNLSCKILSHHKHNSVDALQMCLQSHVPASVRVLLN